MVAFHHQERNSPGALLVLGLTSIDKSNISEAKGANICPIQKHFSQTVAVIHENTSQYDIDTRISIADRCQTRMADKLVVSVVTDDPATTCNASDAMQVTKRVQDSTFKVTSIKPIPTLRYWYRCICRGLLRWKIH